MKQICRSNEFKQKLKTLKKFKTQEIQIKQKIL